MKTKPDPHDVIRGIEQSLYAFRRDYPDYAPRLIGEHLDLAPLSELHRLEDEAGDLEAKDEELSTAHGDIERLTEGYLNLHRYVLGIVDHCYKNPRDLDSCSAGTILMQLADALVESENVPEDLEAKVGTPIDKPKQCIGLDYDDEHSIPADLITRIVRAGLIPPETLRAYAIEHLADLVPPAVPSPGPGTPAPEDERSASTAPAPQPATPAPAAPQPAAATTEGTGQRLRKRDRPKKEVPRATAPPVMTRNEAKNGIELRFNGKPSDEILRQFDSLRFNGAKWKWSASQPGQPWYIRYSEEAWVFARSLAEDAPGYFNKPAATTPAAPETPAPTPAPAPQPEAERSAPAPAGEKPTFKLPGFLA